ncbi:MAG TPA: proton-conducting transporter membrane subunit [Tepidisphaeraceae bacterium]|jgi:NAD(P)H-quinone oxidoreductase subunit 5|nr:proton-conducting transporter membrane subunit [Tepidisphaeraceae bacterium]
MLLMAAAGLSAVALVWQIVSPQPLRAAGITVDRLSAALSLLVAAVGAVTFRFSIRYMDGDPRQARFLGWMAFAVVAAFLLMLSTNLLLLVTAWSLTSVALHQLLTHYEDRPEAIRAARKKFLISRIGDAALLWMVLLVWSHWDTLDLHALLAATTGQPASAATVGVALSVVLAALTKSAQFPFHSWLPETMEAPTPVSALMHAGIINAGGVLLLRFAPLLVEVPAVLLSLVVAGSLTVTVGTLAMWAQVKVKRSLAWSTVNQMGFMMVQCGLAAFPAAALHIIGHGCYKAWAFLRAGDVPAILGRAAQPVAPGRTVARVAIGMLVALPAIWLATWITGFSPLHSPGEMALAAVVALAMGQVWAALFAKPIADHAALGRGITGVSVIILATIAAFGLYRIAGTFLAPVLGDLQPVHSVSTWIAALVLVTTMVFLTVIHAMLPVLGRSAGGRAFRVHALHGFYFGAVADRIVASIWKHPKGKHHA